MKDKKNILIIFLAIIVIALVTILALVLCGKIKISTSNSEVKTTVIPNGSEKDGNKDPNSIIGKENTEQLLTAKEAEKLYSFIPKMYEEGTSEDNIFVLDSAIGKIKEDTGEGEINISTKNVDEYVTKIFGEGVKIDKDKISEPDSSKSLYYYSKDTNSYAVIPMGFENTFALQMLKEATETNESYYVYSYIIRGLTEMDEIGGPVKVTVKDKDGKDITQTFKEYKNMFDEKNWLDKYSDSMIVLKYTLKKDVNGYHLTQVEQISY